MLKLAMTPKAALLLAAAVLCTILLATTPAAVATPAVLHHAEHEQFTTTTDRPFDRVIAFGDSLTDTSNVWELSQHTWPLPPPLYDSGRFSNGPMWIEYFTRAVVSESASVLRNYAYGSATTDNALVPGYTGAKSEFLVPDLNDQLRTFQQELEQGTLSVQGRTLYTVWFGGNDIIFSKTQVPLNAVVGNLIRALQTIDALHTTAAGTPAPRILVFGMRNLGAAPFLTPYPAAVHEAFQTASDNFNTILSARVLEYDAGQGRVTFVPTAHIMPDILASPAAYGFPSGTQGTSCLSAQFEMCKDPEMHVYWDTFHPATGTHRVIAQEAAMAVGVEM
ncbi:hypothetical protein GGF31_008087 [Allomyces arbusculus]|nr:hypothetical protein GGF31_008087 [Allomyces arbusculus]